MINSILVFVKKYKIAFILAGLAIGIGVFSYLSAGRMQERHFPKPEEQQDIGENPQDEQQNPDDQSEDMANEQQDKEKDDIPMGLENYLIQPDANRKVFRKPVKAKGIYVSGWVAGTKGKFGRLLKLVNDTELNAMVIDVKEDGGRITYDTSKVPWVQEVGAGTNMIRDIKQLMATLKENNVYPIARIVCFKDPILGEKKPELSIKKKDGTLWRDNKGLTWLNPYNPATWDYLIELSKEAAKLGFKEIQFDYVRFPTDGNVKLIDYGEIGETKTKSQAISEFLAYAEEQLDPMGVDVSADIFGIAPVSQWDAKVIGQELEWVSKDIDYICPMVYPSHYANVRQNGVGQRINGVLYQRPDLDPYGVVYNTLVPTRIRLEESHAKASVRPWLQSFTADYLGPGYYQKYGGKQIREQIQATYDAGFEEWILWDANNNYTAAGLLAQ